MIQCSNFSFPLQDIFMCESVSSALGLAKEGTLSGDVCPSNIRYTHSQTLSTYACYLCSTFSSDTYGRQASLFCRTLTISLKCLYQISVKCFRWWQLVIGYSETSVDMCIQFHFEKPFHKLCFLWARGD